ncbi:hypothetical protein ACOSQ2_010396 [Xanthoceras sorbifolium]
MFLLGRGRPIGSQAKDSSRDQIGREVQASQILATAPANGKVSANPVPGEDLSDIVGRKSRMVEKGKQTTRDLPQITAGLHSDYEGGKSAVSIIAGGKQPNLPISKVVDLTIGGSVCDPVMVPGLVETADGLGLSYGPSVSPS